MGLESLIPLLSAQQSFMGTELKPKFEQRLTSGLESLFDPTTGASRVGSAESALSISNRKQLADDIAEGVEAGAPKEVITERITSIYGATPDVMGMIEELLPSAADGAPINVISQFAQGL